MMNHILAWTVLGALIVNLVTCVPTRDELQRFAKATRVKRVIGGTHGAQGQFKYLTSLKGKVPRTMWWGIPTSYTHIYCGGTIVDKRYIVSAAHCFQSTDSDADFRARVMTPKYWHVLAGETQKTYSWWNWGRKAVQYHGQRITVHPNYRKQDAWANDVAVIKLESDLPITTDPDIDVIALPTQSDSSYPTPGEQCTIMGWGCSTAGGAPTENVKYVDCIPQSNDVCKRIYGSITPSKICCGGNNLEKKGICQGDSGGPLVCNKNGRAALCGIASYTSTTNQGNVPGVFSRATSYTDWIRGKLN